MNCQAASYDDGDGDSSDAASRRRRQQHRQQRGAAQLKGFRTAQWLKSGVVDGLQRLRAGGSELQRTGRVGRMDNEGVSHF